MSAKKKVIGKKEKETKTIVSVRIILFCLLIILFCLIWLSILFFVLKDKWVNWLLFIYSIFVSIVVGAIISVFATDIRKKIGQYKIWSNPNLNWIICGILLVDIVSVGYLKFIIIPNQGDIIELIPSPDISVGAGKQHQFDSLVGKYESMMKIPLTIENAQKTLKEDSLVVSKIVRLLEQNPALDSISKFQYAKTYNDRVDSAMTIIVNAVYLPDWTESELDYMVNTYSHKLKEIEQMKINP